MHALGIACAQGMPVGQRLAPDRGKQPAILERTIDQYRNTALLAQRQQGLFGMRPSSFGLG